MNDTPCKKPSTEARLIVTLNVSFPDAVWPRVGVDELRDRAKAIPAEAIADLRQMIDELLGGGVVKNIDINCAR